MLDFLRKWYNKYLSTPQAAILVIQFISIFVLVYYFNNIIGPILAALVLAFIFERPVSFLVKHGTSRLKACILVMLTYITVIVGLVVTILPPAMDQLTNITKSISNTLSTSTSGGSKSTSNGSKSSIELNVLNTKNSIISTSTNEISVLTDGALAESNATDTTEQQEIIQKQETSKNNKETVSTTENVAVAQPNETANTSSREKASSATTEKDTDKLSKASTSNSAFEQAEHWIASKIKEFTPRLPEFYQNLISEQQIHEAVVYVKSSLKNWLSPFLTNQVAPIIMDTFSILLYMVIVPIFTFYMLKDKAKWLDFGKKYLAPYEEISNFWHKINILIGQYLNGNLIHIAISSIINGVAFWLYGLNYSLILGIGVGLSVIIPYVGSIIITVPLLIVGIIQYGFSADFAWLLVIYLVIQLLDAYLLTPMLFSETLDLDAFTILLAIMIFGGIWGFWGVVLAIPLATFIKTAFAMWPKNKLPIGI